MIIGFSAMEKRVGGFVKNDNVDQCKEVLKTILEQHKGFTEYQVTHCEKQLVNGINFRMTLVNPDK